MTPAYFPVMAPPSCRAHLYAPPCNWNLRGELSVDGGHQHLHHETERQRAKPTASRHHRLHTDDGIEPRHR